MRRACAVVVGVLALAGVASAQPVRVSVATDGTPANHNSLMPTMSASGRFVAFMSFADNLVPNDTNNERDVFLRDRDTDTDGVFDEPGAVATIRVSQLPGVQANGPSGEPRLTPDGRYVVFTSFASNLFATGQGVLPVSVVLRWDRLSGDIVLVSQTTGGQALLDVRSVDPDVSNDGNQVVFVYGGSLQNESDLGYRGIIYRRDIAAGTLTQVDTIPLAGGVEYKEHYVCPTISGDGATIAYGMEAKSSLHGKLYGTAYVADAATNAIRATYSGYLPRLSRDGAFVALLEVFGSNIIGQLARYHLSSGERRGMLMADSRTPATSLSPSGRHFQGTSFADFVYGSAPGGVQPLYTDRMAFDAADAQIAYSQTVAPTNRVDVFVEGATAFDRDGDGLRDSWEALVGLLTNDGAGDHGPAGDPDHDGLTNAQEEALGLHARGTSARFLAEGASGTFFSTRYAIANPNTFPVSVAVRLELSDGSVVRRGVLIEAQRGVTVDSQAMGLGTASFSARFESDNPIVVDRLMTWTDAGGVPYGSHAEASSSAPATSWFLAEGSTVLGFQLFYLLQNPQETATTATVRFLLPSGAPVVRSYDLPAHSRTTIYVNTVPGLASTDVSADITATQPIAVERAMYRSSATQTFALGHAAGAVAAPATSWFFGEGATGTFFDTYLLLANPSGQPATVTVDYLRDQGGAVTRTYTVPANSRFSVYVDGEPGMATTPFGTRVTSTVPIVAERAMYWAGGFFDYYEGHVSAGATQAGSRWVLALGQEGEALGAQTYVLIANTGNADAMASIRALPETGPALFSTTLQVPANSRLTYPTSALAGFTRGGLDVREVVAQGGSLTNALVVEGAIYWNVGGVPFAAGANWPATRLP